MESVIRGAVIYLFLWTIFRLSGKRTLHEISSFDLVLLLIISEATQQALLSDDFSLTNAMILIIVLVTIDVGLSLWKRSFPKMEKILDDCPVVVMENGKPLRERMTKERVDENDVIAAARELHGIEKLDQIKYAILERSGSISIVPKS